MKPRRLGKLFEYKQIAGRTGRRPGSVGRFTCFDSPESRAVRQGIPAYFERMEIISGGNTFDALVEAGGAKEAGRAAYLSLIRERSAAKRADASAAIEDVFEHLDRKHQCIHYVHAPAGDIREGVSPATGCVTSGGTSAWCSVCESHLHHPVPLPPLWPQITDVQRVALAKLLDEYVCGWWNTVWLDFPDPRTLLGTAVEMQAVTFALPESIDTFNDARNSVSSLFQARTDRFVPGAVAIIRDVKRTRRVCGHAPLVPASAVPAAPADAAGSVSDEEMGDTQVYHAVASDASHLS